MKQVTLNEKLVGLCYHEYSFIICNYSKHILVVCVLFKIWEEFGLNLGLVYCSGLDEYSYKIFHKECEFYSIIKFRIKISS
jgi:hypothetical protein